MDEIIEITNKYSKFPYQSFASLEDLNQYTIKYIKDLAKLIDVLSRIRNTEFRPNYYSLNECTILGSFVRIVKLYNEIVRYYEEDKLEILALFTRPLYESFIMIKYLIKNGEQSQRQFRLI